MNWTPLQWQNIIFIHFLQGIIRFYDAIIQAIIRHINFDGELVL